MSSRNDSKDWSEKASEILRKIFGVVKSIFRLISEFIHNTFNLTTYTVQLIIEIFASADFVVFIAGGIFAAVLIAAGYQWGSIGVWIARSLGFGGVIAGIAASTTGMAVGIGFNVYQLFPSLWRLRRKVAKAYANKNIDPQNKDLKDGLQERLVNWHSFSHRTLERGRYISYLIETAIQLIFWATVQMLSFNGMLMLVVTLILPEVTISVLSAACDIAEAIHSGHQESGGRSSKGGGDSKREAPTFDVPGRKM
jgi:hypothetical protein